MSPRRTGAAVAALAAGLALGGPSAGDVVVLGPGKSVRGTVFREANRVRVNLYRCTLPEMTWGVQEHPVSYVRAIEPERTASDVYRALDALPLADAAGRRPLAETARALGRKDLVRRVAEEVLRVEPADAPSLAVVGSAEAWAKQRRGDVRFDPALAAEVRRAIRLETALGRRAAHERLAKEKGLTLPAAALERMARGRDEDRGERHDLAPRLAGAQAGGTFSAWVPWDYDPLAPRPLLLVLHGGGPSTARGAPVMGSGREGLSLFVEGAKRAGFLVVAPTALETPWTTSTNDEWLLRVLDDAALRWNVDLDRVAVAGQGAGADGALSFAVRHGERFAFVAAAGSSGGSAPSVLGGKHIGVWLYHGEKDEVAPVEAVRKAAERMRKDDAEFVYCELPNLGHGFPPSAETDLWRFAAPRRRAGAKSAWPRPSFEEPVGADEVAAYGDPTASWADHAAEEVAGLLAALRAGRADAEAAARRLAGVPDDAVGAAAAAIVADRKAPVEARVLAAWVCGARRDLSTLPALGDAVRAETDARLLRAAAASLRALGSPDALEDVRSALRDAAERFKRRAYPGVAVPFAEFDRSCRLVADLVETLAALGKAPDLPGEVENAAVIRIFRDGRPIAARADAGEDPSEPRVRLAEACARAYRALGAEKTLYDMLGVVLKGDRAALDAAARGARQGLPKAAVVDRGPASGR